MRTLYVKKGNYGFSTHLKNEYNGKACDMWIEVQFSKSNTPEDSCKIEVLDSFLSCYDSKDGVKPKLVVTNYKIVEENNILKEDKTSNDVYFDDIKVDDDFDASLPF